MNLNSLLIKNGMLVSSEKVFEADVLIKNKKIKSIQKGIEQKNCRVIDASGLHVLPGIIDPQVHFRDPGLTHKEDLRTGSMGAAAGGITTFFEMPNTKPSTTTLKLLSEKNKMASEKSLVNYSFFLGATSDNLNEIERLEGNCGLKIFMGSSTGDLLVDNDEALEKIFSCCNRIIAVHAEDEETLNKFSKYTQTGSFSDHVKARPVEAAVKATQKAVDLALKHEKRLHVLHISTADEVDIIRKHKSTGLITGETTPQHLLMHAPDIYNRIGSYGQMNPPIREKVHQKGLWDGLRDGTIDCIATDHAPHTIEEKQLPYGKAPSGMPGVETSLSLMLNQVSEKNISISDVVRWMSESTSRIYNIKGKGKLEVGYDADITLVDMEKVKEVSNNNVFSKCGWSAFDGMKFKGCPVKTIVNGSIVFENDTFYFEGAGKEVVFSR